MSSTSIVPLPSPAPRRVLVVGATGPTGRELVDQALARGLEVTAFVRDPQRLPVRHPRLDVQVGDATDAARLAEVVPGHHAVLSAIGAPARSTGGVRGRSAAALVEAMREAGVDRLISLSSHGVGEGADALPWWMRWVVVPLYLGRAFADHAVQEAHIRSSDLAWTLVKPPHLSNGPRTEAGLRAHGPYDDVVMTASRADVAAFMLDQLDDDRLVRSAPIVAPPSAPRDRA